MSPLSLCKVCMCGAAIIATAMRQRDAENLNASLDVRDLQEDGVTGPDFSDAVLKMKAVDWFSKGAQDLFTVFESDGLELVETVSPAPGSKCSLETLKTVLLECPTRGKICIALYKFNYPRNLQSATLKSRSILVYGLDIAGMNEAIGSFGRMKVVMGFTSNIWSALKNALSQKGVSPTREYELSDRKRIEEFSADYVWDQWKNSMGRIGDGEKESFLKHAEKMIAAASGAPLPAPAPAARPARSPSSRSRRTRNSRQSTPSVSSAAAPAAAAAVDVKEIESIAKKVAQEEVGNAIRILGTKIGDATREVGKTWVQKSLMKR